MLTHPAIFDRLIEAAAMSLLLCALGSAAVLLCRQPIRRMRIIILTLGACILAPVVSFVPWLPHWSLSRQLGDDRQTALADAGSKIEEAKAPGGIASPSPDDLGRQSLPAAVDPIPDREPIPASHSATATPEPAAAFDPPTSSSRSQNPASWFPYEFPADPHPLIVVAYLAGLVGLAAWWLVGLAALGRVLRVSRPAPAWCRALLSEVAGPAGARVQILVSSRAVQPFTFAWRHPVIVLPMAMVADNDNRNVDNAPHEIKSLRENSEPLTPSPSPPRGEGGIRIGSRKTSQLSSATALRCCLAHEWSHIAHGDVWTWSLAGIVRLVYYYQPLCWWLRRQLRLSQDYLADAAAARQSSPLEYAEFLATRALGRPLAVGLGITAGKSDLYRRVSMLLKDNRPLESHCPAGWKASVGACAVVLVIAAATFGDRTTPQASSVAKNTSVPASDGAGPASVAEVANETDSQAISQSIAAETKVVDPATRERDEFVAALLKRAKPPRFFLRRSTMTVRVDGDNKPEELRSEDLVGGDSWRVVTFERFNTLASDHTELFHAGRAWKFSERRHKSGTIDRTLYLMSTRPHHLAKSAELSNSVVSLFLPPPAWEFLEEQAQKARLGAVETVNDIETRVVEWKVFGKKNVGRVFTLVETDIFKEGGILRLYVAPGLNHAVTRVEHVDRSGTVHVQLDSTRFEELAPGMPAPREYRGRIGEMTISGTVDLLEQIDPATAESQFVLKIPAGTQVRDERPHPGDVRNERGLVRNYDKEKYPNRQFIAAVDYPDGLPDELLKKMDQEHSPPAEPLRDDTSQLKPPAQERENVAPPDSERQKLIDGMLARADAIKSGQFAYTAQASYLSGQDAGKARTFRFVLSGERWAEFEEETPDTPVLKALNDGSHYFKFASSRVNEKQPTKRRMTVDHPRRVARAGLWTSSLIEFRVDTFRKHVADARLLGTEMVNGVETKVLEWPVSLPETRRATPPPSESAQGVRMLRVYIAPQFGFAVVKLKHVDKFGLAESVADFSEFKEVAPGLFFPFREQYQDRTLTQRIHTQRVADINQPIPEQLFVLRIPTGTQIEDVRAHRNDKINGNGPPIFDSKEYPLRNFMTWAEDLDGLPPTVLAEMDRDLLSPEEWERIKASGKDNSGVSEKPLSIWSKGQVTKAGESTTAAAPSTTGSTDSRLGQSTAAVPTEKQTGGKEMFRYAGKSFHEWRDVLLTDLDPVTRIKACEALQAFGPTSHTQEIAAAVQEALKTDQPDVNDFKVQKAAFELLARLGAPAVPVLESQLASPTPQTRRTAIDALARVAATTDAAVPVLLRAAKDGNAWVRGMALRGLIMEHPQSAGVVDAWSFALANDEDWSVQEAILEGLIETRRAIGELPAAALFKPLESNVGMIRTLAAVALALRGPGSDLVIEKVKRALLESAPEFRLKFVNKLFTQIHGANQPPIGAATLPVLVVLLETESTYTQRGGNTDVNAVQIISQLPMDGPARAALPVLVQAAEGKLPGKSIEFRLAAITALGKAGAAAKEALPALHQLLDGPSPGRAPVSSQDAFRPQAEPTGDSNAKWRSTLQSAIQRIEGN